MPLPPLVAPLSALSASEKVRTSRHSVLDGFGEDAQRRLAAAHVALVGAGGLGSPAVLALAAAGVGTITIIDDDSVELSNLQRQVIHRVNDVGSPKVDSAVRVAGELSPETQVRAVRERLTKDNAAKLLSGAHVVLDGSDTFDTRRLVAAACEELEVPLVWGVVQGFHAQVTIFWSTPPEGESLTLDDLYPTGSVGFVPSCAEAGVLGSLTMQVGAVMATEAIKLITGTGEPLFGRVLIVDALRGSSNEVPLRPAKVPVVASGTDAGAAASAPLDPAQLTMQEMHAARRAGAVLLDVREPEETAEAVLYGSLLIPLGQLLEDPSAAGEGPFVVICARGARAERAALALRARGVQADILAGGLMEYDVSLWASA